MTPDLSKLRELLEVATPDNANSCPDCGGHGETFGHSLDCDNDSCALNGDIDSCDGTVSDCHCWIAVRDAAVNALPHLIAELTTAREALARADKFLTDLVDSPDLNDIAADGGITVGMVFKQQAKWERTKIARALHSGEKEA